MFSTTEPFLSAELAYRHERAAAGHRRTNGLRSSGGTRRSWLRARPSWASRPARHLRSRLFHAH